MSDGVHIATSSGSMGGVRDRNDLSDRIPREGRVFVATGGYSSVWQGFLPQDGGSSVAVAIKVLRAVNMSDSRTLQERLQKRLEREMRVWKLLAHVNIVPFLGFALEEENGLFSASLVSPWYKNGNVVEFLARSSNANVDKEALCMDVAVGLRYLHGNTPPIIHGDMKSVNILINEEGRAVICDFGLAIALDDVSTGFTSSVIGGTARFLAPELIEDCPRTFQSDVYAFACVCLEIVYGKQPYHKHVSEGAVLRAIERKECPYDFEETDETERPMHKVLRQCWRSSPSDRPTMIIVCAELTAPKSNNDPPPFNFDFQSPYLGFFNNMGPYEYIPPSSAFPIPSSASSSFDNLSLNELQTHEKKLDLQRAELLEQLRQNEDTRSMVKRSISSSSCSTSRPGTPRGSFNTQSAASQSHTAIKRRPGRGRRRRDLTDESDDDDEFKPMPMANPGHRREEMRRQRIESEQRRRDELRENQFRLKEVLLPLVTTVKKWTRLELLNKAATHIRERELSLTTLTAKMNSLKEESLKLQRANEILMTGYS